MGSQGLTSGGDYAILYASVSGVLAGAVWGDHCSPISDTTVMSSLSAGCDHIEHVRTQLPYAVLAGAAALLFGTIPTSLGSPAGGHVAGSDCDRAGPQTTWATG